MGGACRNRPSVGYHDMMQPFDPPTADEVEQHLHANPPSAPSIGMRLLPMVLLVICLVFSTAVGGVLGFILPWFALAAMILYITGFQRQRKRLAAAANAVQDQVMLRNYVPALRASWTLVPKLVTMPGLHGQTIAAMAHALDQLQLHEQAARAYAFLLENLPSDHPAAWQIQLNLAVVALTCEALSDADDLLRKLRPVAPHHPDPTFAGQLLTARLAQMTLTHHDDDAIATAPTLLDDLRPLGVDAGYGHGLLALAYQRQAQAEAAKLWWDRATLLVPRHALVLRYPQLGQMLEPARGFGGQELAHDQA